MKRAHTFFSPVDPLKPKSPPPLFLFLLLLSSGISFAQPLSPNPVQSYADRGQLILTPFASAPFPHPARASGHSHNNDFFSFAEHYNDSTVALFVPNGFRPGSKIDFVIHFHGWNNNVTNALAKYRLIDQFVAASRNAILIVPEGPRNADDSFGGKLEDPGGLARFMDEAMRTLGRRGAIGPHAEIGRIILSGHSGGYEVISAILARGGLIDHIHEVWLFDALYAHAERFVLWFDHHPGRFVDIYTDHGGTKDETENLMAALAENHVPFSAGQDTNASSTDLRAHLVFLHTDLPHDQVMQDRDAFATLLQTSDLRPGKIVYKLPPNP